MRRGGTLCSFPTPPTAGARPRFTLRWVGQVSVLVLMVLGLGACVGGSMGALVYVLTLFRC